MDRQSKSSHEGFSFLFHVAKKYLNYNEASGYLGIEIKTLRKLVEDKTIPHILVANEIVFSTDDLDKWMDQLKVKPNPYPAATVTPSEPTKEKPRYMDYKQMSEYLLLSQQTLRRYVMDKVIPHLKIGRSVRFDVNEIDKWVEQSSRNPIGK